MKIFGGERYAFTAALELATRLNPHGSRRATRDLIRKWQEYFHFCDHETEALVVVFRVIRAAVSLRVVVEFQSIRSQWRVCALAFAESPEVDLLIEAINAERQAMGNLLIGKRWSPQAWLVLVAAVRNGVDLHSVARLMRLGQVKVDHGMLVTGILRPGLAAVTIGGMATAWFAVLAYNMYILNPQSPQNALTVFGGGMAGAVWLGSMMFRAARAEKVLVTRIVGVQGPTLVSVRPRRSAALQR